MKKSNFITGILYILVGSACLIVALFTESKLDGLLWGFAGAGIVPGIGLILQYFYWTAPKHRVQYQARLEQEEIERHDELKEKLRDKSGRYAYIASLIVISLSMVAFSVLGSLEIIENTRVIVLYLGGYLAFQVIAGIVIFNQLLKKY